MQLSGKQIRHLRGLGHHLQPIVMIGRGELNERVVASLEEALSQHELIKVKLQEGCDLDRHEAAEEMARLTKSAVAQVLGKTILLYRRGEDPQIKLP